VAAAAAAAEFICNEKYKYPSIKQWM